MKVTNSEKYLGDIINNTGSLQETIEKQKSKGQGIITEIMSILNEIPLGKYRIVVALKLREVMLLNGILYNSEAWHGITKKQTKILESIDEDLLRRILKLHSKTPKEFLYLETGSTPIKWVLKQRRINYLKHILSLEENEIVKKVYTAQKQNPTSGDFVQLVEKDLMDLRITQAHLELHGKSDFKKLLKNIVTKEAFKELLELKEKHTKVKHIEYDTLKIQNYLQSPNICTEETQVLASLRSNCIKTVRTNFPKLYKNRVYCPLKCEEQNQIEDTQEHLLT